MTVLHGGYGIPKSMSENKSDATARFRRALQLRLDTVPLLFTMPISNKIAPDLKEVDVVICGGTHQAARLGKVDLTVWQEDSQPVSLQDDWQKRIPTSQFS